ncbi:MAG TPA: hypothetical protein VLA32_00445 [Anaerolineales bacterium]|jgi:predicted small lipoprotein YifL|nr:hypothetical protein [Anaerolineales bacterium]
MKKNMRVLWMSLILIAGLAGCGQSEELPPPPTETTAPLIETMTSTVQPTDTSQPPMLVLLSPAQGWGDNHALVEQAAAARGLVLDVRQGMSLEEAPQNLRAVVTFGNMPGLDGLISGLPQVQFLVLGASGLPASPNLTMLEETGSLPELGFVAGYIAGVQAEEWRIGIISVADPAGQTYRDAFINGVHYFCGICNPKFPPYEPYPLYAEVAPGGGDVEVQQAADALISRSVDMIHVAPALQSETLYQYLAERSIRIIGTDAPPAGLEANWVASVISTPELAMNSVLDSVLDGQSLGVVGVSLNVNYTGISQARLTHFAEIISKLYSGEIDPVGLVE